MVKDLLGLLCHALSNQCILLSDFLNSLLLSRLSSLDIDFGDARESAFEAGSRLWNSLTRAEQFETKDVRKGDDVVVPGLAGQRCGRVWGSRRCVDCDCVEDVAACE
jgi:hypothetical protein